MSASRAMRGASVVVARDQDDDDDAGKIGGGSTQAEIKRAKFVGVGYEPLEVCWWSACSL